MMIDIPSGMEMSQRLIAGTRLDDLIYRLRERSRIRRQIPNRKSVQEGARDRIADLLDEAADVLTVMSRDRFT